MPFDLNILCFNQITPNTNISFQSSFSFDLLNKVPDEHKYYGPRWQFMNQSHGFWYYLFPADESLDPFAGCYNMCDIYYIDREPELKLGDEITTMAEWWEYLDQLPVLEIKKEFRRDFEQVVDFFLDESPSNMILFLPRFQGREEDVVKGVYSKSIFFEMLDDLSISFNTCYIIRKDNQNG